ncbi:hypothetical protein [Burkholderia cepacia]|uniref:Transmembrane protein n=1 Tax=Burkholderia cepacia GG4 TaxID=1009846 RepID=A0A9W3K718_BURCE|nr:hypothetical protein [Burkholderia cepacia]AFQ49807.1 hypothetical protein GEM_3414 [Burkholderia cepacia GG4]
MSDNNIPEGRQPPAVPWHRSPIVRSAVLLVGLFVMLPLLKYQLVSRLLAGAISATMLYGIFREWITVLRPFRTWLIRRTVRVMRKLRPIAKLPPDVTMTYGLVAMMLLLSGILWIVLNVTWIGRLAIPVFVLLAYAAARHTYHVLRLIARWTWSKALGKGAYLAVASVALWLARSDAEKLVLTLTHETADHFSSFTGLSASAFFALRLVQAAGIVLLVFLAFQFVLLMVGLLIQLSANHVRVFSREGVERMTVTWRRLRLGLKKWEVDDRERLRQMIAMLAPIGLVFWAVPLLMGPTYLVGSVETRTLLSNVLVRTTYSATGACRGDSRTGLFARIGDDRVSEAVKDGDGYVFRTVACKSK